MDTSIDVLCVLSHFLCHLMTTTNSTFFISLHFSSLLISIICTHCQAVYHATHAHAFFFLLSFFFFILSVGLAKPPFSMHSPFIILITLTYCLFLVVVLKVCVRLNYTFFYSKVLVWYIKDPFTLHVKIKFC